MCASYFHCPSVNLFCITIVLALLVIYYIYYYIFVEAYVETHMLHEIEWKQQNGGRNKKKTGQFDVMDKVKSKSEKKKKSEQITTINTYK